MIRDFIGCMDTARKKYATLKEQDPDGPVIIFIYLFTKGQSISKGLFVFFNSSKKTNENFLFQ